MAGAETLPMSELMDFKPTGPTVDWESDIEEDSDSEDPNPPEPPPDLPRDANSLPMLPIWAWQNMSCSLDAMMMIALLGCLHMPDEMQAVADSSESSLEFKTVVGAICGYPGTWEDFNADHMTSLRELIRRNLLEQPVPIKLTIETPLDSTFDIIVAKPLRGLHIHTTYMCTKGTCRMVWSKVTTPEQLNFRGAFQHECESVQSLVDLMVFSIDYHADL